MNSEKDIQGKMSAGSLHQIGESSSDKRQDTDDFNASAIFGRGLVSCIVPMVNAIDNSVDGVRSAQVELAQKLQELSESLRRTQDTEARGPDLDNYVKRIAGCRKRLMVTGTLLNNVQSRTARLQVQGKKMSEVSQQHPQERCPSPTAAASGLVSG